MEVTYLQKQQMLGAGSKEVLARGDQSERRFAAVDPKKDSISILIMGVDDSNIRENLEKLLGLML